jgi:small conductance mechanosensitive channel
LLERTEIKPFHTLSPIVAGGPKSNLGDVDMSPPHQINIVIPDLMIFIELLIIVAAAIIIERLTTRYLKRFAKRRSFPPNVGNGLVLVFRIMILLGALVAAFTVGGLPTELLVTFSALGGAAVGFASTRTVGNFIAGLYVLAVRPFRVRDYVRIGNVEGIVEEITLNYTRILTASNTNVLISNQRVLDQDIVNFRFKGRKQLYCYNFELSFSHAFSVEQLEGIFDHVIEGYAGKLGRKPEYQMTKVTHLAKCYIFYLYVENPKDIFTLQPDFVRNLTVAQDEVATKR